MALLLLLASSPSAVAASQFTLQLVDNDPRARCLDGTRPGYYIRQGNSNRFKIHLSGGGWCTDDASCEARANGTLGSSRFWPPVANSDQKHYPIQWDIGLYGLLGDDPSNHFSDWTSVFVMYCDGSSFTSDRAEPVVWRDGATPVYHRGKSILAAVFSDRRAFVEPHRRYMATGETR